ncbi:MAG: hypothetical protein FWG18_00445 [Alphaproteobacteria bacterium]|nr:hypothetical protein [Alphaproteobacteria bacterium]
MFKNSKILFIVCGLLFAFCMQGATAAEPVQRRGQGAAAPTATATVAARGAPAQTAQPVAARVARTPVGTAPAATITRSGTTPNVAPARAATSGAQQKVMGTGTTVAAAASTAGVVNPECRERFFGCMDSFCMSDTANGGRCLCSDQQAEMDKILADIEALDAATYKMATEGVERIELGAQADYVFAQQAEAAKALEAAQRREENRARRQLDLSQWNIDFENIDAFGSGFDNMSTADPLAGKSGDALHTVVRQICMNSMAGCEHDIRMLQTMYSANISSDCRAFNNELNRRKQASQQKLAAAERAIRDAALETYQTSNKWDLGQCTVEFRRCMISTGGCRDDFTGCVGIAAAENAASVRGGASKMTTIKGERTSIQIAASSWDALVSKRPLCDNVTNSCQNAIAKDKDAVWMTFLREIAPTIKSAELLAESNLRQNCIGNISECFRKACQDNIDPANPEGSFDMCLTRPDTLRSLCKVQIDPCERAEPQIMNFVRARLLSMRVDSCTSSVKECLTSEDRCGRDYTQCIGLDTDTIIRMCPAEKLVACQYDQGSTGTRAGGPGQVLSSDQIYEELATLVQGIMLNIDNSLLAECQKAADTAMIKVCGDVENCNDMTLTENVGGRSVRYEACNVQIGRDGQVVFENGKIKETCQANIPLSDAIKTQVWYGRVVGMIDWSLLEVKRSGEDVGTINVDDYLAKLRKKFENSPDIDGQIAAAQEYVIPELREVQNAINLAFAAIESDARVGFCITGREVQGMNNAAGQRRTIGSLGNEAGKVTTIDSMGNQRVVNAGRFPNLTNQMRIIMAVRTLQVARANYNASFDKAMAAFAADMSAVSALIDNIDRDVAASEICEDMAQNSMLAQSGNPPPIPKKKSPWKVVLGVVAIAACVVGAVFTGGATLAAIPAAVAAGGLAGGVAMTAISVAAVAVVAGVGITGVQAVGSGLGMGETGPGAENAVNISEGGVAERDEWNFKEKVTTTFNRSNRTCLKCRVTQNCQKQGRRGDVDWCETWADPQPETCQEVQL